MGIKLILNKLKLLSESCIVIFFVLSLLFCSADVTILSDSKPEMAPINQDYLEFLNLTKSHNAAYSTGFIPPESRISDPTEQLPMKVKSEFLPSSYDLRDLNRVTSIKNQNPWGTCWAFAAMASMESNLLPNEYWDFSEKNLVNRNLKGSIPDSGGNYYNSGGYFAAQLGPLSEEFDPYPIRAWNFTSPTGPVEKNIYEIHWLPDKSSASDLDFIKKSVMNYGALSTTYYENNNWNNTFHSYYYPTVQTINHAVAIVGWDDKFSRYNFTSTPPGDGALLIKNSWGSGWGDNGYEWISYYDANVGKYNTMFFASNISRFDEIYQHDLAGPTTAIGFGLDIWGSSRFNVTKYGYLKGVGFYTTDNPTSYTVKVFKNPITGPISGEKMFETSGIFDVAGYHVINISESLPLNNGDVFSIVVHLINDDYIYSLPVQYPSYTRGYNPAIYTGDSYYSRDGMSWSDLKSWRNDNTTACIKGYMSYSSITPPVANFSSNITSGPIPLYVQFTDTSTGGPTSWTWDFGDGKNSTVQNPIYSYFSSGLYSVNLMVANTGGSDTKVVPDYINATSPVVPPVAGFIGSPRIGFAPLSVQFTDTSTGSPTAWIWDFGDSGLSREQHPLHMYSGAGLYTVSLNVSNAAGSNLTSSPGYINVSSPVVSPVAGFIGSPRIGFAPLSVQFTDLSSGNPSDWSWSFGDNETSASQNPVHTYSTTGLYTVNLTVSNSAGSSTKTALDYINAKNPVTAPVANFSANRTTGTIPLIIQFTDLSTGNPSDWSWSFGDNETSASQNPVHTYSTAGLYTVNLTVSNSAGSNTKTASDYINAINPVKIYYITSTACLGGKIVPNGTVHVPSGGHQTFSVNADSGYSISDVLVDNVSQGKISSYPFTNVIANHTISAAFAISPVTNYTIVATAGTGGSISPSGSVIVPSGGNQSFTISPDQGYKIMSVLVDGENKGVISSYLFTNVTGNHQIYASFSSTEENYQINSTANSWSIIVPKGRLTYPASSNPGYLTQAKPGSTLNEVTVDNESVGAVRYWAFTNLSSDHTIHAESNPTPGQVLVFFDASPRTGRVPLVVNFYDQSLGMPTSWYWQFGDGSRNKTQNPQHTYNIPGVYTVTLRANNKRSGGTGQWNNFITVTE